MPAAPLPTMQTVTFEAISSVRSAQVMIIAVAC